MRGVHRSLSEKLGSSSGMVLSSLAFDGEDVGVGELTLAVVVALVAPLAVALGDERPSRRSDLGALADVAEGLEEERGYTLERRENAEEIVFIARGVGEMKGDVWVRHLAKSADWMHLMFAPITIANDVCAPL